ncbi:Holliday junction resolvase RecU [Peribacillus deserti]|uniref:Holliday junction resolvase RecU n=1 Tax=Peribacillus deserti TaxID=673318 RepID=A0A2N5M1Y2_9BACI|nr:Holliday junction resolvase RecU [Peribacillus deserti]PLT28369.1 Holliday junction resolvase RecU [Peribacillus deserti]
MAFNYPNGRKFVSRPDAGVKTPVKKMNFSNRGMTLEEDINASNEYYLTNGIAVVHKKPTPVQIVDVHYPKRSAAVIKEAYFKQTSTTDYNGVYRGRYIDFEAKETQNPSSFPLKNFHSHQIEHMQAVMDQGAIAFVILRFTANEEIFLMKAEDLIQFWERMLAGGRKSIAKPEVEACSSSILLGFQPRIDYIKIIEQLYASYF